MHRILSVKIVGLWSGEDVSCVQEWRLSFLVCRKAATLWTHWTLSLVVLSCPGQNFQAKCTFFNIIFTGPGRRLDQRLNPDLTPKEWSKPISCVDRAAYQHDLAYAKHRDTANRNITDRIMVNQLNSTPNPTLREQMERAIVTPILATKEKFGLGIKKSWGQKKQKI